MNFLKVNMKFAKLQKIKYLISITPTIPYPAFSYGSHSVFTIASSPESLENVKN